MTDIRAKVEEINIRAGMACDSACMGRCMACPADDIRELCTTILSMLDERDRLETGALELAAKTVEGLADVVADQVGRIKSWERTEAQSAAAGAAINFYRQAARHIRALKEK